MSKYVPPSFDRQKVRNGLLLAMGFGMPNDADDQATFYTVTASATGEQDAEKVPFDPAAPRARNAAPVTVDCAVEYHYAADQAESFGVRRPEAVTITLLQEEYALIEGFNYVVCGGDKYVFRSADVVGLGSVDVWSVRCVAGDVR